MNINQFHKSDLSQISSAVIAEAKTLSLHNKKTFDWIIRFGIILSIVLGFWYLLLVNSLATRGFTLEEEKNKRASIIKDLEKWDIELTIPTSLYALKSSEQVQAMKTIKNKDFLALKDGQVAMR